MAMSGGEVKGSVSEINVTPLIDVLLVLLIIFMVIVPTVPHGLESVVPTPSKEPAEAAQEPVMLEVRAVAPGLAAAPGTTATQGTAAASYRVDGGDVAPGTLGRVLREKLAVRQRRMLMVTADRSLAYDDVAQAMSIAKDAGAWPIGIAGTKELAGAGPGRRD